MIWLKQKIWQLLNFYAMLVLIIRYKKIAKNFSIYDSVDVPEHLNYVGVFSYWERCSIEYNEWDATPAMNLLRDIRYWQSPQAKIDMEKIYSDFKDINTNQPQQQGE